jgi:hypothetical protein
MPPVAPVTNATLPSSGISDLRIVGILLTSRAAVLRFVDLQPHVALQFVEGVETGSIKG